MAVLRRDARDSSSVRRRFGHPPARLPDPQENSAMPQLEFALTGDYVELHNLLKLMGLADSGGSAKARVAMGDVKVDGRVELRKTCKIRAGQTVMLDGSKIKVLKPA
jgi:ribosome-associated protein